MTAPLHLHLLSTSMRRERSISLQLLHALADEFDAMGVKTTLTDAADLPFVACDGRDLADYPDALQQLTAQLRDAHGVVIGFPIHYYAPSGAAHNLIEIVGEGLEAKPIALVSAAGSQRSHLAVAPLATSLIHEVGAHVFPDTIQGGEDPDPDLEVRVKNLATSFARFVQAGAA